MTEMVQRISSIAGAVKIPLIADGDTGYGNAINVMRTVNMYEQAGCAAIQLEDQEFPKRCGHLSGKVLISSEEMGGKIKAACDARIDKNFVIIARTDALAINGMKDAINRANLYIDNGADVIFVEAPANKFELLEISKELKKKRNENKNVTLLANMVEGGKTPLFTNKELEDMGYGLVIYPNSQLRGFAKVGLDILQQLKENDTTKESLHLMKNFNELNVIYFYIFF